MEKNRETCLRKYGVACYFDHPDCIKSNGTRISKFQTQTYKEIFKKHPDALLEVYLPDVKKSVDIYIPSEKKIIECYGDYWHCNPSKCKSDYYNEAMHMTAQEIWDRDTKKQDNLKSHGYSVDIVWENTNKKFRHSVKDSMK